MSARAATTQNQMNEKMKKPSQGQSKLLYMMSSW